MTKLYKAIRNGLRDKIERDMQFDLEVYSMPDDCGNTDNRTRIYPDIVRQNCRTIAEEFFMEDIAKDFDFCHEIADAILEY